MTNLDLLKALAQLSLDELLKEAMVFPPGECPATTPVPVTELSVSGDVTLRPGRAVVILTGKKP